MRRYVVLVAVCAVAIGLVAPPAQADVRSVFRYPKALQKQWMAWAFGSDTNPLFDTSFCGEQVGGKFFLNAAAAPLVEADCEIPRGVPVVATPGGTIVWAPTDGPSNRKLLATRDALFADVTDPRVVLDGDVLPIERGFAKTWVYTISVGQDSLIRAVDPGFPASWTETKVASAGWFIKLVGLPVGHHRLVLRDRLSGDVFKAIFHIDVEA